MKKPRVERNICDSTIAERPTRKSVHFPIRLRTNDSEYAGFIINISTRGLGLYINTQFPESTINCDKGSILNLEMQSPLGEKLQLQCSIRWLRIQPVQNHSLTTSMGLELIAPPEGFIKLFNTL